MKNCIDSIVFVNNTFVIHHGFNIFSAIGQSRLDLKMPIGIYLISPKETKPKVTAFAFGYSNLSFSQISYVEIYCLPYCLKGGHVLKNLLHK